jgi:two-component system sensor histidine kinase AlgZ
MATWEEERHLCEGYLRIEHYRLGDRLRVKWHGDLPAATPMPLLTLQPLLENAILHGLQPSLEGGDISIAVGLNAGVVELLVSNSCPRGTTSHQGSRMALENIRARVTGLFGPQAQLESWRDGERFFSRLVYPVRQTSSILQRSH